MTPPPLIECTYCHRLATRGYFVPLVAMRGKFRCKSGDACNRRLRRRGSLWTPPEPNPHGNAVIIEITP